MLPTFGTECLDRTERQSRSINAEAKAALPSLVQELARRVSESELEDWKAASLVAELSGEWHNLRFDIGNRLQELDWKDDAREQRPY
jgi:hypothetical protein